ncbi:DUF2087 domain-containing protein [Edaphobacillus lindanitolerans]|nr:DUF2087 domain-containing protein [Edaphobacillus lindanitolerans]
MRFEITEKERETTVRNLFKSGPDGPLDVFPAKEKKKWIVACHLAARFETGREYTESEVNETIKEAYPDFATIRRFMIDYRLMERDGNGHRYRRVE